MNKLIILLIGILIGVGAGIGGYVVLNRSSQTAPPPSSDSTANWQTYTDEQIGFTIRYPQYLKTPYTSAEEGWITESAGELGVLFGPASSRMGGFIWVIEARHKATDLETQIASVGKQHSDRQELRSNVVVDGQSALLVTVTTPQNPMLISKTVYIVRGDQLITISNGANDLDEFDQFYQSFRFVK